LDLSSYWNDGRRRESVTDRLCLVVASTRCYKEDMKSDVVLLIRAQEARELNQIERGQQEFEALIGPHPGQSSQSPSR
jgi:hypothetical protein